MNISTTANLTPEEQINYGRTQDALLDDLLAQCMHEAGFQYLPYILDEDNNSIPHPDQTRYMDNLSEAELEAWWDAKWGPPYEKDANGNFLPTTWEDDGCNGWATHERDLLNGLNTLTPWAETDEFRLLFEAIDQLTENILNTPEVMALDYEWANCMADSGFPELHRQIEAQARSEIEVFDADENCQTETDYLNRIAVIVLEAETQFVNDHRVMLEAFRATTEQRG